MKKYKLAVSTAIFLMMITFAFVFSNNFAFADTSVVQSTMLRTRTGRLCQENFNSGTTSYNWNFVNDTLLGWGGSWSIEDGKLKSVALDQCVAVAYPSGITSRDLVWEARVQPMKLDRAGPALHVGDFPLNQSSIEAVFGYYNDNQVLKNMIYTGFDGGTTQGIYKNASFSMREGEWYTLKMEISGFTVNCYIDGSLVFTTTDPSVNNTLTKRMFHQGFFNGEWGYWDDIKIWRSNTILVADLASGQKVELISEQGNTLSSAFVMEGSTVALLDVSELTFPLKGYFKAYAQDRSELYNTAVVSDIWGGDEYRSVGWSKTFGDTGFDEARCVVQTQDGGYALSGSTQVNGTGSSDIWLIRTDNSGNARWNRTYGGQSDEHGYQMIQTSDGGFALVGSRYDSNESALIMYLIRTDSAGNLIWHVGYLCNSSETIVTNSSDVNSTSYLGPSFYNATWGEARYLAQTSDGGFILCGSVRNHPMHPTGDTDAWVIRVNSTGEILWDRPYFSEQDDFGGAIIQTGDGGFIFTGTTQVTSGTSGKMWLIKINSTGEKEWERTYSSSENSTNQAVSLIQNMYGGYSIFGSTSSQSLGSDFYLIKTDSLGNQLLQKTYGREGEDVMFSAVQSPDAGFMMVGTTKSFGSVQTDVWIIKTDSDGIMQWTATIGGELDDGANWVTTTRDGRYVFAGFTHSFGSSRDVWLLDFGAPQPTINLPITITSNPPGNGYIQIDWEAKTSPQTLVWTVGSVHSLQAAPSVSTGTGVRYRFVNWVGSSIGNNSNPFLQYTVPEYAETLTAVYRVQNLVTFDYEIVGGGQSVGNVVVNYIADATPWAIPAGPTATVWADSGTRYEYSGAIKFLPGSGNRERWITFSSTSGVISSNIEIPIYYHQYFLSNLLIPNTVVSVTPSPTGDSWYDNGSSVNVVVQRVWNADSNNRTNLFSYTIDGVTTLVDRNAVGTFSLPTIQMDSFREISNNGQIQYSFKVIGGFNTFLSQPSPTNDNFYDANTQLQVYTEYLGNFSNSNTRHNVISYTLDENTLLIPIRQFEGRFVTDAITFDKSHILVFNTIPQYVVSFTFMDNSGTKRIFPTVFDLEVKGEVTPVPESSLWIDHGVPTFLSQVIWSGLDIKPTDPTEYVFTSPTNQSVLCRVFEAKIMVYDSLQIPFSNANVTVTFANDTTVSFKTNPLGTVDMGLIPIGTYEASIITVGQSTTVILGDSSLQQVERAEVFTSYYVLGLIIGVFAVAVVAIVLLIRKLGYL